MNLVEYRMVALGKVVEFNINLRVRCGKMEGEGKSV